MGFSSENQTGTGSATGDKFTKQASPSFGDRLGSYFQQKYPVAGGLSAEVFGNGQQGAVPQQTQAMSTEMQKPPEYNPPNFDMLMQNSQPKQGGFAAIAKLLMGA